MGEYLLMRKAGTVQRVHYLCDDIKMAIWLRRIFDGIKYVNVLGTTVEVRPEHREFFKICHAPSWPEAVRVGSDACTDVVQMSLT